MNEEKVTMSGGPLNGRQYTVTADDGEQANYMLLQVLSETGDAVRSVRYARTDQTKDGLAVFQHEGSEDPIPGVSLSGAEFTPDDEAEVFLQTALDVLRDSKPNDRSEKDRRYAVTITMVEQALAYFVHFAAGQ